MPAICCPALWRCLAISLCVGVFASPRKAEVVSGKQVGCEPILITGYLALRRPLSARVGCVAARGGGGGPQAEPGALSGGTPPATLRRGFQSGILS